MSLGGHLNELAKRVTRAALALVVGTVVGFALSGWLLDAVQTFITAIEASRDGWRYSELR